MPVCTEYLDKAIVEVTGTFDVVEEISAELREGIVNYTVKPVLSGHPRGRPSANTENFRHARKTSGTQGTFFNVKIEKFLGQNLSYFRCLACWVVEFNYKCPFNTEWKQ